jgi:uncharacterized protein (TIGR02246 family)
MTTASDDRQIRTLYDRLLQAWTDGDAQAYGQRFTPDADYVSYDGTRAVGRAPMVDNHDRLFRGVLAGSALVGEVESVRHVGSDVAIVHANGSVLMPWRRSLPRRRFSRQTLVAVRTPEGWRFTALHNTRVRPQRLPEPGSFPSRASHALAGLARLVRRAPGAPRRRAAPPHDRAVSTGATG